MDIEELHSILSNAIKNGYGKSKVKVATINAYADANTAAFLYIHGSKEKEFVIEADEIPFIT